MYALISELVVMGGSRYHKHFESFLPKFTPVVLKLPALQPTFMEDSTPAKNSLECNVDIVNWVRLQPAHNGDKDLHWQR